MTIENDRAAMPSEWTRPPGWLPGMAPAATGHRIGTREEWAAAREGLLAREKEHTRLGDELARQRRELPWVRVEQDYCLDSVDGSATAGGALRRPEPAAPLPLHVRSELSGGLPDQLVDRGHHRPRCSRISTPTT